MADHRATIEGVAMEEKAAAAGSKGGVGAQEGGEGEKTSCAKARTVKECVEGRIGSCVLEQSTASKGAPNQRLLKPYRPLLNLHTS